MDFRDTLQAALGSSVLIERELGGTGASRVFIGRDIAHDRDIVIKVVSGDQVAAAGIDRFDREIALAARLQHAHILSPLSSGAMPDGTPYFIMPFAAGESLRDRLVRDGDLPVAEATRILRDVASAIAYAHQHHVVHGDIKPDNVRVSGESAVVSEFGVTAARLALSATGSEHPSTHRAVDDRADIHAFGMLGYEMLAGEAPASEQPRPIQTRRRSVPPALATLLMQCLEQQPADRPQTAAELLRVLDDVAPPRDDVERANDDFPLASLWPVESPTLVARSQQFRNRLVLTLVIVVLLFAAAAFVQWRWSNRAGVAASTTATPPSNALHSVDSTARGTPSARARDLYLRGRVLQAKQTEPELRQSIALFQDALKADPTYALAWSGIADSWGLLSDDFVAPDSANASMREAVARGLAIDSSVAALRFTQGLIAYLLNRDARAAQWYMSGALAADPDLASGTAWYPQVLWANGLRDSASAYLRHAVDRDSTSPDKLSNAWIYAHLAGNTREARRYCGRLMELHAGERCNALEELDVDRPDAAVNLFQRAAKDSSLRTVKAALDYVRVLVAVGQDAEARNIVDAIDRRAETSGRPMRDDDIALMHGLIGDNDGALTWYERALGSGSSRIGELYWETAANPLRKDPRLLAFAKRAGLQSPPPYWP